MVTPRRTSAVTEVGGGDEKAGEDGRIHLVYKDGQGRIEENEMRVKARYTNWHGGNLDPDSVRRHQHQLKRAGFRDNAHAKGGIF